MDRCLIVFDMNTKDLEQNYHNASWRNAYADIGRVLNKHNFVNIQGTVYLGNVGVRQAHGTLALQEVAIKYDWFAKCVENIQFYDLADDFNASFIIDGVEKARQAFNRKLEELRVQLIQAGLTQNKIDEIIGKQKFSIDNATQSVLPPMN